MKRTAALMGIGVTASVLLAGNGLTQMMTPPVLAQQSSTSQATSMPDMTRHTMDGEVTKVDAKKGWIDVKTPEGRMKLHYPSPTLDNVKAGDRVTVELGMSRGAK